MAKRLKRSSSEFGDEVSSPATYTLKILFIKLGLQLTGELEVPSPFYLSYIENIINVMSVCMTATASVRFG